MPEALATAIWEAREDRRSVFMVVNNRLDHWYWKIDGSLAQQRCWRSRSLRSSRETLILIPTITFLTWEDTYATRR